MTEVQRLYGRYIAKGKTLVTGKKYSLGKWYTGYKFVVMCDNAPILACRDDGSMEIIRAEGEKIASQLQKLNMA